MQATSFSQHDFELTRPPRRHLFHQLSLIDNYVEDKLADWGMQHMIETFRAWDIPYCLPKKEMRGAAERHGNVVDDGLLLQRGKQGDDREDSRPLRRRRRRRFVALSRSWSALRYRDCLDWMRPDDKTTSPHLPLPSLSLPRPRSTSMSGIKTVVQSCRVVVRLTQAHCSSSGPDKYTQ
ncbi:hypothetical protein LSAT2_030791 [Lamellibrachia satsuma]|nr:hypothetical protein LSAT2_030791 [Lamellibrachia satsuma]